MKKKIKVLQVIPRLGYGGAETGCYDLAHFLPEKGVKSYLITSGGELLNFINKKKVKVFKFQLRKQSTRWFYSMVPVLSMENVRNGPQTI